MTDRAWYEGIDIEDVEAASVQIRQGSATHPHDWEARAIEQGIVTDAASYHDRLRDASLAAFEADLEALTGTADRALVQLVRTLDATTAAILELRQHIAEAITEASTQEVRAGDLDTLTEELESAGGVLATGLAGLLDGLNDLDREREQLRSTVEQQAMTVAPNLTQLAGPLLAARLIAAAGSLEDLAKLPSSTMQVLGAEGALFAHLRGEAPAPKHGLIFTHPSVRSAPGVDRGRVARALAGKLTIATRIDHYRGELEPTLEAELADRLTEMSGGVRG